MRLTTPFLIALLMLAGSLSVARAADTRPVDLPLASGKTLTGVVESSDAREVVVRVGPDEVRRVPWSQLRPRGVYRAKAALAPAADGDARLALAELAVEMGLYREARAEFEKALALGALDRKTYQQIVATAEQDAVEAGVGQALKAAEDGDIDRALQTARELKLHFSGAPNAAAIDKLIRDLLKKVGKLQTLADKDARELERAQVDAERNKEILKRTMKAIGQIESGRKQAVKAAESRAIGNVTRSRKYAEAADKAFTAARRNFGRLRRIVSREHEAYRDILRRLNELDVEQFQLLFATAWFFWDQRVYSQAERWAARASYIDPVHPELLELRDLLRSARIRYRASDITNARPIIR